MEIDKDFYKIYDNLGSNLNYLRPFEKITLKISPLKLVVM